jgi:hypothetical protein
MANNFDRILDECIDRINRGEGLEACLADYPQYIEQLRPLLQSMLQTRDTYSFAPSVSAKEAARQRFTTALARREQRRREKQPLFTRLFARPVVWATLAAAIVILVGGYFGFRPVLFPTTPGSEPVLTEIRPVPVMISMPLVILRALTCLFQKSVSC